MKQHISSLFVISAILAVSCSKTDPNAIVPKTAPDYQGVIECVDEVDLGLKAKWASCNLGASSLSDNGAYFAWGETSEKAAYCDTSYSLSGVLSPGQKMSPQQDPATLRLGYGWRTPSVEDWQELIDSCTISFAAVDGQVGYIATSNVKGFEGRSIFLPCAGYKAEGNTNNVGYSAIYWSDQIVDNASTRAVNAFFTTSTYGAELRLNAPPKGVGGLVWCGYPVRAVRRFYLDWDAKNMSVKKDVISVSFNVSGNSKWNVSASDGASCIPEEGEAEGQVTVSFPENDTYDTRHYTVSLVSPEFKDTMSFVITQFGIIPDFKFENDTTTVPWDAASAEVVLVANSTVSWTGVVKDEDGQIVEGASIAPSNGIGGAVISVIIPSSTNISGETEYFVELTTEDARIPETIRTIKAVIIQAYCPYTPFGYSWANSFLKSWKAAGFTANQAFVAENAKASAAGSIQNAGADTGYLKGKFSFEFTVAESGTGVLGFYAVVGSFSHSITVDAFKDGSNVFTKTYKLNDYNKTLIECEMTLEKGDVVRIKYNNGSGNAKLYCSKTYPITWKKK